MRALDVYIHGHLAGRLVLRDNGLTTFQYDQRWLARPDAAPISLSLPLREQRFPHRECIPFFSGVLPEGRSRELIARILGISETNDFALLERIGGECAGAVTLLPEGTPPDTADEGTRALNDAEFAQTLHELRRRPLLVGSEGLRLSLAGAQDKLPVRIVDGRVALPLGTAASTHIIKPASEDFDGLVFNEAFCLTLAQAVGLPTSAGRVGRVDDIDYLVVERFDRRFDAERVVRIHQEDFCQGLGLTPERKYQGEGGPSLKRCFDLLRAVSAAPVLDLGALLDAVVFNFVIGNNDAHGKNFALLHREDGTTRLAPLYDLVSTAYYPDLARNMAMRVGRQAIADRITPNDLRRLAKEAGLAAPLVLDRAVELMDTIHVRIDEVERPHPVSVCVAALIRDRAQTLLDRFRSRRD